MLLATDTAQAFWALLLPHGLQGGALSHVDSKDGDDDDDVNMVDDDDEGWQDEHTQWWFEFLNVKGGKGVSKDTWVMVCCAVHVLLVSLVEVSVCDSFWILFAVLIRGSVIMTLMVSIYLNCLWDACHDPISQPLGHPP